MNDTIWNDFLVWGDSPAWLEPGGGGFASPNEFDVVPYWVLAAWHEDEEDDTDGD